MTRLLLWHTSFDIEPPFTRTFVPRIPQNTLPGENANIPRICFAPSIEDCLNAMGERFIEDGKPGTPFLAFPFFVQRTDPALRTAQKIARWVPDAEWTNEHWYLRPLTLKGRLMRVNDFSDYTFYDAGEQHRSLIYKMLIEQHFSDEQLKEFDNFSPPEILANIPPWLCYEIARELGLCELHAFEWLDYEMIVDKGPFSGCIGGKGNHDLLYQAQ